MDLGIIFAISSALMATGSNHSKPLPVKTPALAKEMHSRATADQEARGKDTEWMDRYGPNGEKIDPALGQEKRKGILDARQAIIRAIVSVDRRNTQWLKNVVRRYAWPTISLVGKEGSEEAWLLVQHADLDPAFQRLCLDLMAKLPEGEISKTDFAYLTDRVLIAEGKKQLYGTQFIWADGKSKPMPIVNEANVDKRRMAVGLKPLADYAKELEEK